MTLLETIIDLLRQTTAVPVRYGRAADPSGTQIVVTHDETPETVSMAEVGFDIDIYAPDPDPAEVERLRRLIVRDLHYRLIGQTDDFGAVRVFLRDQAWVDEDDDWTHWTMRLGARVFRSDWVAAG